MSTTSKSESQDNRIRIRGARVHNLRGVDVDIPRDQLVVITGPSGSGKSSLAFDTLYAEGQRQYIESLSVHARQFLDQMERPDVDLIDGLQPTICIDQRPGHANPRSTVATVTEVYDYLRLFMARLGSPTCFRCGAAIQQRSPEQIQDRLMAMPENTKAMILAPMVRGRKGQHRDVLARIRKAGFVRARINGEVHDIENVPELSPRKTHHIDAVVDRVIIRDGVDGRVGESVRLALQHGEGLLVVCYFDGAAADAGQPQGTWRDLLFSTIYACPDCNLSLEEIEPRTFSFNSPYGACPECDGLGNRDEFDPQLVLPDLDVSVAAGAIAPWKNAAARSLRKPMEQVEKFLAGYSHSNDTPLSQLSEVELRHFIYGNPDSTGKSPAKKGEYPGLLVLLEKELATSTKAERQQVLESFRGIVVCGECKGTRLRPEARNVFFAGRSISDLTNINIVEAKQFFQQVEFDGEDRVIAAPLLSEIVNRLEFLEKVGVGYLTLSRSADTLSGGEFQRVRLATSIGSGLVGVCYVLDEPSIGLHPRDNQRLIDAIRDLQQHGNTVVVVEHDVAIMRQCDRLIDIGPGAGAGGGNVVAEGTPESVAAGESITGRYLNGTLQIPVPKNRRRTSRARSLTLTGATANNLQAVDARFPLAAFVCVTGVSGSGKSSLVNATLVPAVVRRLGGFAPRSGPFESLRGVSQLDKVIQIDQAPIGRSPRSNAATYTGIFDEVRKVFANTRDAKQRGFRVSRFSFNVKGGRCEECQGHGHEKIEMNFLADLFVTCSVCQGARFNRQTLQVKYKGKSIADVLRMSVDAAAEFFESFSHIQRTLVALQQVGLGYLGLGQSSTTLSGGEAQRIKLASQLARVDTGQTLYVLDEPTTGLHIDDIRQLLDVLSELVDRGNSVIVIEHNLDVIKCADWILDLGPEGGDAGGRMVATGTPEDLAALADNETGKYLREVLSAK